MTKFSELIEWQGIKIQIDYMPKWTGCPIDHIEIWNKSEERGRLPITETGYRSHFIALNIIKERWGGCFVSFVKAWLEEESQSEGWISYIQSRKQLDLFA